MAAVHPTPILDLAPPTPEERASALLLVRAIEVVEQIKISTTRIAPSMVRRMLPADRTALREAMHNVSTWAREVFAATREVTE